MPRKLAETRPARLPENAPIDYAPENEQGVVFLFSYLARKFGLRVERVRAGFPDCTAYRDGKRVRIEFEYRSRNFALHRHDQNKCDWIVCWIHDWPGVPDRLRVIELRKEYGLGFNVWFQPVAGKYRDMLANTSYSERWSVASQATEGDLLLFHRTAPDSFVRDIFRVATPVKLVKAQWKTGKDRMAQIRRVGTLKAPLHFSQFHDHRVLRSASFVRGQMRKRYRATAYWPELYRMIVDHNPSMKRALREFEPSRVL